MGTTPRWAATAFLPWVILGLAAAFATVPVRAAEQAGSLSEGKQVYLQACGACHGSNGQGHGPAAPALVKEPPDLTRLSARHGGVFPHAEVLAIISGEREIPSHGSREMPVWTQRFGPGGSAATGVAAVYARRRLELLTGFIESLQRHGELMPTPGGTP